MKKFKSILSISFVFILLFACNKYDQLPIVKSGTDVLTVSPSSVVFGGNVIASGGAEITARGLCYGINPDPKLEDNKTINKGGLGIFTDTLQGLLPNTAYYARAYASNANGTSYGDVKKFTTQIGNSSISTSAVTNISSTTATCGGEILSDGGSSISARGVCWSTTNNPTVNDNKTSDGTGIGVFVSSITGLSPNVTYFVRSYAINLKGVNYGDVKTFTTTKSNAILSTLSITNITNVSASCGGNITSDGGSTITGRGICWSTNAIPTISDSKTSDGNGTGSFVSALTNLAPFTTYYACAYAVNSIGVSYGNIVSFTTQKGFATVNIISISNIGAGVATSGGTIVSDGGDPITARGLCWGISPNPTIANNKTSDGAGTSNFVSTISDLNYSTTYYVRAYVTNFFGTNYSNSISFTTTTLHIGDVYKGGKVAYILQSGDPGYSASVMHGLIVSPNNLGPNKYGCYPNLMNTSINLGTGAANTNTIVSKCSELDCAAKVCYDLVVGLYSDWYLPSKDELNKLYLNRIAIGGFTNDTYHSSSEYNDSFNWCQNLTNGSIGYSNGKLSSSYFRAVRSF